MPIRLEHIMNDLKNLIEQENVEKLRLEEIEAKLEAEKKSPEIVFKDLLYSYETLKSLTGEVWKNLRDGEDVTNKIQEEVKKAPDVIKLSDWYDEEMAAQKEEEEAVEEMK